MVIIAFCFRLLIYLPFLNSLSLVVVYYYSLRKYLIAIIVHPVKLSCG